MLLWTTRIISVLVILLLIANIILFIFVLDPKRRLISSLEFGSGGIVELNSSLEADKAFIKNLKKYEMEYKEAEKYIEKLKNPHFSDGSEDKFVFEEKEP